MKIDSQGLYQFVPVLMKGEAKDPIHELFVPPSDSKEDPSDVELRHALANMVAIVFAYPPCSNHLWYHMFAGDTLQGTYMTGFMYDSEIKEGLLYDCGVELAADGTYGRPDYIPHATRGTLSLHSLYLLLWANFGAFCIALLTQPDAQEKLHGHVISSWQSVRHYCMAQLRKMWLLIGGSLKLSLEEQSFFIMTCMRNILESPQPLQKGKFDESCKLDVYEKVWHDDIFIPSYTKLHEKYADYCELWQNTLLRDLSCLSTHYPCFPTMREFSHALLSSKHISDASQNQLYVLSQFALEYPRLKAAGALLPDLIELYRWLHNELAYLVTQEYAEKHSIGEVITKANKKYAGLNLEKLYERVKDNYNRYVEVIGHAIGAGACANVKRKGKIYCIEDSTKLLHFLSVTNEEGEGYDWLHIVIADIIQFHNEFIERIHRALGLPQHAMLKRHFPDQLDDFVYPTEVSKHACIVGTPESLHHIDQHVQLVRSRYHQPTEAVPSAGQECTFDMEKLQEDVIRTFLVGKPSIHDPSQHLRVQFKFKELQSPAPTLDISDIDVSVLSGYITTDSGFREQLQTEYIKELQCEFHTANIHMLVTVVRGLRTTTEHLIKSLHLSDVSISAAQLKELTVPEFLLTVYNCKQEKQGKEMIEEIGINGLSSSQLSCLLTLKLSNLYSTLELFVLWIKDGRYDFHQLPLHMKKHMEPEVAEAVSNLFQQNRGPLSSVLTDLQELSKNLVHCESYLSSKQISEADLLKPMTVFLKEMKLYEDEELVKLIPDTVLCHNYVELRVLLRRQIAILQNKISTKSHGQSAAKAEDKWWSELATELWKEGQLKHLRDAALPYPYEQQFAYDPSTGLYGFQTYYGTEAYLEEEEFAFIHTEEPSDDAATTTATATDMHQQLKPASEEVHIGHPQFQSITEQQLENIAKRLTTEDVATFIKGLGLQKYTSLFTENDIDGDILWGATDSDLKDMGISSGIDRRKVLRKFKTHVQDLATRPGH